MRLAVGLDGHRRNARIGDLEIVELTQAEAHLVGGAHRGPVRCYYVAFQTRIERSEERRVGKECKSLFGPASDKEISRGLPERGKRGTLPCSSVSVTGRPRSRE